MKLESRHILALIWLTSLLMALGLGGVVPVAALVVLAAPAVDGVRWYRLRRFRRHLREVAALRGVPWREPRVVDGKLEWSKTVVMGGEAVTWKPALEPRPMTDGEIVEWLRPLGGV